jgi:hypothetical protein
MWAIQLKGYDIILAPFLLLCGATHNPSVFSEASITTQFERHKVTRPRNAVSNWFCIKGFAYLWGGS